MANTDYIIKLLESNAKKEQQQQTRKEKRRAKKAIILGEYMLKATEQEPATFEPIMEQMLSYLARHLVKSRERELFELPKVAINTEIEAKSGEVPSQTEKPETDERPRRGRPPKVDTMASNDIKPTSNIEEVTNNE